jgi:hypothetical protein
MHDGGGTVSRPPTRVNARDPGAIAYRRGRAAQAAGSDALWRALRSLRSTATWLMFGAHPGDEWNGFLAWLTGAGDLVVAASMR